LIFKVFNIHFLGTFDAEIK
jgi:glyceraldehyde 3-phosphate dehydrogenase